MNRMAATKSAGTHEIKINNIIIIIIIITEHAH